MAKLPRSPIAQGVTNQYRPVQEARASGADPVGGAMQQVGNAGFEIASRMADAKIAADAAEASIRLRSRLDEEYRAIENDMEGDPSGFEARFRERAAAVANEEAGRMSSPAMKRAFAMKSLEMTETFGISMRDVTRRRQVEGVKAQTLKVGADYQTLAQDPAKPRELLDAARDDYLSLIDQQVKAGIYTPDVAEAARIAAREVYQTGVSTRHLSTVDTLLDQGRAGEAEAYFKANYGEITPAEREKAEGVLEAKSLEAKAIAKADTFWAQSGGDYGTAIAEAAKIENPDERLAVESRIAQLKNQGDAAEEANDKRSLDAGMEYITTGRAIPASVMRAASPKVRDMLQTEQRTRAMWEQQMSTLSAQEKAAVKEASNISKDYFKGYAALDPDTYMSGPMNWSPEVTEEFNQLIPEHRSEILADINERQAKGGTFTAADTVLKDVLAQVPMLGPSNMKAKDLQGESKSKGAALKEEQAVRASLYRQAQEYAKRTGGAPITPQESKIMIARAFREANSKRYPFEEPGAFMDRIAGRVASSPVYQTSRAYLKEKLGREPTDAEVMATMQALGEVQ